MKSYIIHLESAKERKRHVDEIIKLSGATMFPAFRDNPGARGCYRSHIEIYKINPEEPVIVFEDDCVIIDPKIIELVKLNAANYDIIYFGVTKVWSQILGFEVRPGALPKEKTKQNCWGTHAIYLSPKVKKLVLDHDSKYGYVCPIDLLLNRIINENDLRVFIPHPINRFVKQDRTISSLIDVN